VLSLCAARDKQFSGTAIVEVGFLETWKWTSINQSISQSFIFPYYLIQVKKPKIWK
jgi:hypothetical protein